MSKRLCLLTFGSVNYASTAGGYAAVTKGLNWSIFTFIVLNVYVRDSVEKYLLTYLLAIYELNKVAEIDVY